MLYTRKRFVSYIWLWAWLVSCAPAQVQQPPQTPSTSAVETPMPKPGTTAIPIATPTSLATATAVPTPDPAIPTPTPKPLPSDYLTYDTHSEGRYCDPVKPLSEKQPRLRFPIDVAVSSDGESVYVVNQRCDSPFASNLTGQSLFYQYHIEDKACYEAYVNSDRTPSVVERTFVYKLNDKQLEVLDDKLLFNDSCTLNDELEMNNDTLILANQFRHIFYLYKGNATKIAQTQSILELKDKPTIFAPKGLHHQGALDERTYFKSYGFLYASKDISSKLDSPVASIGFPGSDYFVRDKIVFAAINSQLGQTSGFSSYHPLVQISQFCSTPSRTSFRDGTQNQACAQDLRGFRWASENSLYFADTRNHAIRKIEFVNHDFIPELAITTLAGNGETGLKDGPGREARFNFPTNLDIDARGNIYVADTGNHAIRKITPEGVVSTLYAETALGR